MSDININRVNIMMGSRCNFHCRHCIQTDAMPDTSSQIISPSVFTYIHHLVKIRPSFTKKLQIAFWGGEPLCYMDIIKQFVNNLKDTVSYLIVTNGSLLTQDIVDFVNNHNMHVVLSNDGIQTNHVRDKNILDDDSFISLFSQIKNRAVDACITAYNQDYYKLWDYLESKLGHDIWINHEQLEVTWNMPEDLYDFDYDAYKKTMKEIVYNAFQSTSKGIFCREYALIENTVKRIIKFQEKGEIPLRCPQMDSMISIDLDGNVYSCHNGNEKIGIVTTDFTKLFDAYTNVLRKRDFSDCQKCPYSVLCGYGCLNSFPSKGKHACCQMTQIFINACLDFIQMMHKNLLEDIDLEDTYDID